MDLRRWESGKFDFRRSVIILQSIGSFSLIYALSNYQLPPIGKLVAMASPGRASEFIDFYMETLNLKANTVSRIRHEFQKYAKEEVDNIQLPVFVEKLRVPGLIIHDREDQQTPYQNALELHKHWKGAALHTTQGLGHNLRSRELVQLVVDFVKEKPIHLANH
ncbi:MAG: alpha/beta hydrolase [Cyclobacterium sp.]|uniref:alpha/beta fold hydrolase n=1 Tax=Cyclobacterium sp. TaxID=1966343 RepID=UPI003970D4F2